MSTEPRGKTVKPFINYHLIGPIGASGNEDDLYFYGEWQTIDAQMAAKAVNDAAERNLHIELYVSNHDWQDPAATDYYRGASTPSWCDCPDIGIIFEGNVYKGYGLGASPSEPNAFASMVEAIFEPFLNKAMSGYDVMCAMMQALAWQQPIVEKAELYIPDVGDIFTYAHHDEPRSPFIALKGVPGEVKAFARFGATDGMRDGFLYDSPMHYIGTKICAFVRKATQEEMVRYLEIS